MILTPTQRAALRALAAAGTMRTTGVARAAGVSMGYAAELARVLAERGFVTVAEAPRHHAALVKLTPKGRRVAAAEAGR